MKDRTRMSLAVGLVAAIGLGVTTEAAEARLGRAAGAPVTATFRLVDYWYGPGYPYPYRYGPPVYAPPPVYVPPTVYVAPPVYVVPQGPAPAQSWYYCDNPAGYYPHVSSCSGPWRQVPAQAPATPR